MEKEEERELFDVAGYRDFSISRRSTEFDRCLHDFTSSPSLLPSTLFFPLVASCGVPQCTHGVTGSKAIKQTIERQYSLLCKQWLTYDDRKQSPYPQVVNAA